MMLNDLLKSGILRKNVNITILHSGLPKRNVMVDIAETINASLIELGFDSSVSDNNIYTDSHVTNIILLCHLIYEPDMVLLDERSIILNLEQLSSWQSLEYRKKSFYRIIYLASKCQVWDYSHKNIELFNSFGLNHIKYFQLGYSPVMRKVPENEHKDIDVLFYGSLNERRINIINELKERGYNALYLENTWGNELDQYISRSKIVLNMHYYDAQIFEIARCYYLMSNSIAVVSELNYSTYIDETEYLEGIVAVPYERLVDKCCELLDNPEELIRLRKKALATIQRFPQSEIMKKLLIA